MTASTLLDIVDTQPSMPRYLPESVPALNERGWKETTLHHARCLTMNSLEISTTIGLSTGLFDGRCLLAKIQDRQGEHAEALEALTQLLQEVSDEIQVARLHYELWSIASAMEDSDPLLVERYRSTAYVLYSSVVVRTSRKLFMDRILELQRKEVHA